MTSTTQDSGPTEYTPESSPYDDIIMRQEANALERVGSIPLIANTLDLMCSYYTSAKKTYPSVTPYLEFAEKVSSSAAHVALSTTKPVVDRLAPTVNTYANRGLDKLEGAFPLICDEPEEIYGSARAAVTSAVSRRIDSALSTTENYVDYYLPPTHEELEVETDEESSDDESDTSSTMTSEAEETVSPKERLQVIGNKVRQRAYRRAMNKVRGVQKRSMETLNQLQFTVDLIRYAKDNMDSTREKISTTVSAANETVKERVAASQDRIISTWENIKTLSSDAIAEAKIIENAQSFATMLTRSCATLLTVTSRIPDGDFWAKKVAWAKDSVDNLLQDLSGKTSFSQLSSTFIETAQKNLQHARQLFDALLCLVIEHGPVVWLAPEFKSDPLEGLCDQDLEAELRMQNDNHADDDASFVRQDGDAQTGTD